MARALHSFTGRDYTAMLEWLISEMRSNVPDLTDYNHSSVLYGLLRLFARKTDLIQLYIDSAFNEGNVSTARFMQSLIDLGTLVDVKPNLVSPAIATMRLTRLQGEVGEISIPEHSMFSRLDGVQYSTVSATAIAAEDDYVDVQVYQGQYEEITVLQNEWVTIDYGGRYRYNLGVGVVESSVVMEDSLLNVWERVTSFYRSQPTDIHYRVDLYADKYNDVANCCFLTLGDGVYGVDSPPLSATVTLLRSDGKSGNTGEDTITVVVDTDLPVSATNTTIANSGDCVESLESFRARLPRVVQTQRRGLTRTDYEALIGSIAGIASCQVIDRSTDTQWPYLYAIIYVHPTGGGAISQQLETNILAQCTEWGHLGDWEGRYLLYSATEVDVDFEITVGKRSGYLENDVTAAIQSALEDLLEPGNTTVGDALYMSDIVTALNGIAGVAWYSLSSPSGNVAAVDGSVPVIGTVSVTYA